MIWRHLPVAEIAWKDVWEGAGLTVVAFMAGKVPTDRYIGHSRMALIFNAGGSLGGLLIRAYSAAHIFLFGAELTQV